jgi:hypothetical protein
MLQELLKYVLPEEIVDYFELVEIKKSGEELHLHLDEKPVPPPEYAHIELSGNGLCDCGKRHRLAHATANGSVVWQRQTYG